MRPGLVILLAVLISCVSVARIWGKEKTREQEFAEKAAFSPQKRRMLLFRFFDAFSSAPYAQRKIGSVSNVWKQRFSRSGNAVDAFSVDASDVVTVESSGLIQTDSLHAWLQNRQASMHSCDAGCLSKDDVEAGEEHTAGEDASKGRVSLRHNDVVHSLSRKNLQAVMRRMSLLDLVDETTADRQANAVRRQGVDSSLLRYAGLTLSTDTATGSIYDVGLPPSLTGIRAQVMRVMPSTLQQVGLIFNEFTIPMGAAFTPSSGYVALVYCRISSFTVYTLPSEYKLAGPVVGLMSSPSNSSTLDPSAPTGTISLPTNSYINISLPIYSESLNGDVFCAFFALNGSMFLSNLASSPNSCLSSTLGDFALVLKSSATTSPAQSGSPPSSSGSSRNSGTQSPSSPHAKSLAHWKLIVGATCLTIAGLAFLVAAAIITVKLAENMKRFLATRHYTGNDEALQDSLVGGSIAPSAPVMRTKPALEIDAARFSH